MINKPPPLNRKYDRAPNIKDLLHANLPLQGLLSETPDSSFNDGFRRLG